MAASTQPLTPYPLNIPGRKPAAKLTMTPPDHWMNLPRRKCDNCGKLFRPSQPIKKGQKFSFCRRLCKEQFHSRGSAFHQVRQAVSKEVEKAVKPYTKCPTCLGRRRLKPCADCAGAGYVLSAFGEALRDFFMRLTSQQIPVK